jgi:hypothetical protein
MIATKLGRHLDRSDYETLKKRAKKSPTGGLPGYKSLVEGAATTIYAATSPDLAGTGGVYLADEAISAEHAPWALDPTNARRLWDLSEQLLAPWL